MTEEESRDWLTRTLSVSRGTFERLEQFVRLLAEEASRQNLVSASTLPVVWSRHIVDSAQLLTFARPHMKNWIDLGTGAGFPGLLIAALSDFSVTLVESRKKRIAFLAEAAAVLGIEKRVLLRCSRVELIDAQPYDAISARAFAPLDRLLPLAARFARPATLWLLPKGKSARSELAAVRGSWQGDFRIEPSITDPAAAIIVATGVEPKGKR